VIVSEDRERKQGFFIRQVIRFRAEFPELQRKLLEFAEIFRPCAILIEDAASGQSLIQSLQSGTHLPILPIKPDGDKVSRANAVSPLVESGRVFLPTVAAWLEVFFEEVTSFPHAPHDDIVDAFAQGIRWLYGRGNEKFEFLTAVVADSLRFGVLDARRNRQVTDRPRPAVVGGVRQGLQERIDAEEDSRSVARGERGTKSRTATTGQTIMRIRKGGRFHGKF
jgi:predicted phage terminase large subunit-like protein